MRGLTQIPMVSRERNPGIIGIHQPYLASGCFALYLVSNLMIKSFASNWLAVGWLALFAGCFLSPMSLKPRLVFFGLVVLLASHALAIPGSIIWGSGNWELTAGVVFWMGPSLLLYVSDGTRYVFAWLVPVWIVHAALIIWAGFTGWRLAEGEVVPAQLSPSGISHNPNIAAGFLVLGIVYLLTRRGYIRLLATPLLVALLFTGSRWGLLVCGMVIIGLIINRTVSWQWVAGLVLAGIVAVGVVGAVTPANYMLAGYSSVGAVIEPAGGDVLARLAVPHLPSILPKGVAENAGLHNVPLRIAVESGIIAALLWVGITGMALVGQRHTVGWWLLLAILLLSMLDYYTWMGHLGGFWWLLIGLLVKRDRASCEAARPDSVVTYAGPELPT